MSEVRVQDLDSAGGSDGGDTKARNYAILDQLLRDCCVELMSDYGLPAIRATPAANDPAVDVSVAAIDLIGRLKNKLRLYNVSFNVNTPRLLVTFPVAELERALRSRFVSDRGTFAGYLDVMIAPGFAFVDSPPEVALMDEGDLVLF
jgi:hypothetical protein